MRSALRLAISNLSARRSHYALLIGAVALSCALIAGVASALSSLNASINMRTRATLGTADVRIMATGSGATFSQRLLETVRAWDGVRVGVPRLETALPAVSVAKPVLVERDGRFVRDTGVFQTSAMGNGIVPDLEPLVRPLPLLAGRMPEDEGEVVIDALLAERLGWAWQEEPDRSYGFGMATRRTVRQRLAPFEMPETARDGEQALRLNRRQGVRLGDAIQVMPRFIAVGGPLDVVQLLLGPNRASALLHLFGGTDGLANTMRFIVDPQVRRTQLEFLRNPASLTVVGIAEQPPLGGRPQCYLALSALQELTDQRGQISQIDIVLEDGVDPQAFSEAHQRELPEGLILQTTERITSGLTTNIRSSQLGFILASVLAFLSAAFIILTGMNTDIARRQRELAILRCIGAHRVQILRTQLVQGSLVGLGGAVVGVPVGVLGAGLLAARFQDQLPSGLVVEGWSLALAMLGGLCAGLGGSAIPAWRASRTSPMSAMRQPSQPARPRGVLIAGVLGMVFVLVHLSITTLLPAHQATFWVYVFFGLPSLFLGYFLLSVPVIVLIARALGAPIARVIALPRTILRRGVVATPFRYGFTAGAMMTGLAIMVAIWTNGRAVLRDWIGVMEFPDAFVSGMPLQPGAKAALDSLPFVVNSCAITREFVQVEGDSALGVRGLQRYDTSFLGFEPEPFFEMTNITWVQGDPETAIAQLKAPPPPGYDGTILVAREFLTARGKGVGDEFRCAKDGTHYRFLIVGVVTSPGLDIASRFFNIGEEYTHQAVHAVFGDMRILRDLFASDKTHIIQVDLADDIDDALAVEQMRRALTPFGLLDVGSGRQIKQRIDEFASGTLLVFTVVAVIAMLTACFGVANLIVAAVETRRFEFGVLRAVGAQRGLLVRLVLGEALLIGLCAATLGTIMGIQGSLGGKRIYEMLLGIQFSIEPPLGPIASGWAIVLVLTLLAAGPAAWRLGRHRPRELLASPA